MPAMNVSPAPVELERLDAVCMSGFKLTQQPLLPLAGIQGHSQMFGSVGQILWHRPDPQVQQRQKLCSVSTPRALLTTP